MALVIRSAEMPDVQGKVGGVVHRNDQYGDHIQVYYGPQIGTPSTEQLKQRRAFSRCSNFWKDNMTPEASNLWQVYSDRHPVKTKKGTTVRLTAWQFFLKINLVRARNELEPVLYPPVN